MLRVKDDLYRKLLLAFYHYSVESVLTAQDRKVVLRVINTDTPSNRLTC